MATKLLASLALSVATYVLSGAALVLLAQAAAPGVEPSRGGAGLALALDLSAQCVACFLAGAVALQPRGLSLRTVLLGVGVPLYGLTVATTVAFWSAVPGGYDMAVLVVTLPFFALGAAWRHAGRSQPSGASA